MSDDAPTPLELLILVVLRSIIVGLRPRQREQLLADIAAGVVDLNLVRIDGEPPPADRAAVRALWERLLPSWLSR